ncbi:MAG TPA: hypothetical protein VJ825_13360 [Gemmatimonadaceae bacterium]|nr:hypothetical protein [Gemmatimonadaceae bacterium]
MIQVEVQAPATPAAPAAPVIARGARTAPAASEIYEGFRAQRRVLEDQLNDLQNSRAGIASQLEDLDASDVQRPALEARLKEIDGRISNVDGQLAANSTQLAQAAAVPGAVVERPPPVFVRNGPPDEAWVLGGMLIVFVMLPIAIAIARRIWRRSAAVVTSLPREVSERLGSLEQAVEATALEVERIGEGQRFLTRLFTEGEAARVLGTGGQQPERAPGNAKRLP